MDFPLTPLNNWSKENRPSSGGNNEKMNDVVIYSEEDVVKDVHQNFVIVFGVTFVSIILFAIMSYLISFAVCKFFNHVRSRKTSIPSCPCSPEKTWIYEKQESDSELEVEGCEKKEKPHKDKEQKENTCLTSKERRKQYSKTRRAKQLLREEKNIARSFHNDEDEIKVQAYKLHHEAEIVLEGHARRHTCSHAMYRDKINFDYKYGVKMHKQYSLQ